MDSSGEEDEICALQEAQYMEEEDEISALQEALSDQYFMMEKLHNELEEEREASATAANAALSTILRLQTEKAIEKMEACQYKRMTEEKLLYFEEYLTKLKEDLRQKESENASLRYLLRGCKFRLCNIDVHDLDTEEVRTLKKSSAVIEKTKNFKRNISSPHLQADRLHHEIEVTDEANSGQLILREDGYCSIKFKEKNKEGEGPDFCRGFILESDSDSKQSEEGQERMCKELQRKVARDSVITGEKPSCSWHSTVRGEDVRILLSGEGASYQPCRSKDSEKLLESDSVCSSCSVTEASETLVNSVSVHDIYEVPEDQKEGKFHEISNEEFIKTENTTKPAFSPQEAMDCILKDDDLLNKAFTFSHCGDNVPKLQKAISMNQRKKLSMPMRTASMNYCVKNPSRNQIAEFLTDFGQLRIQLQHLEKEDGDGGKEQLKVLKEIYKQLNLIETNIRTSSFKKTDQQLEPTLVSVMEAAISFSR